VPSNILARDIRRLKNSFGSSVSSFRGPPTIFWEKLRRFDIECGDLDSQPFNQISNPDAQRIRISPHRPRRDVPLSALDSSDVRPVQARAVRKLLLHF